MTWVLMAPSNLWAVWTAVNPKLDAYAATRPTVTPVVVLEPR